MGWSEEGGGEGTTLVHPNPHPNPKPDTLNHNPPKARSTPSTLHPTPYTLHPTPCNLHPAHQLPNITPYTLLSIP